VSNEAIYVTSRFCRADSCVEAAVLPDGAVAVRDSKDRNKPPHIFTPEEWTAFIAGVKDGDFDFPDCHRGSQNVWARLLEEIISSWRLLLRAIVLVLACTPAAVAVALVILSLHK
jgi:hypothetical protein